MSHQRTIRIIILALFAVVVGTWVAVKQTTDQLLYQDATSTARKWARQLAEGVADLEQIAQGEEPSAASITFFRWSQLIGVVFRYEIFNREGYSQLMSDRRRTGPVDVSEFSVAAARAVRTGEPIVAVREGEAPDLPAFFAEAYVPVIVGGRTIAVVAASVDQTEERERYTKTFVVAAISLCLLTALAFIIPAAAWYRRTNEKRRADAQITFLATHDGMTRLANREHFTKILAHALDRLGTDRLAVHYIDLDRFKEINDTFGHQGGDALLRLTAERIRASTRAEDVVARLGGDQFAVLQPYLADRIQAESLAYRILAILAEPFAINGHEITVTASIGIAMAPEDGVGAERLLSSADLALSHSKADGRSRAGFFTSAMDVELQERLRLERCVREALRDDGFELHFQPLVDMPAANVTGFEALLRLKDADGRPIPPMTFIPIAEEIGLIDKIGTWVIRQACHAAAQWPDHLSIAVNLSAAQFEAGGVTEIVSAALRDARLEPHRLQLEITESLLLRDANAIMLELRRIKALGVAIVMDDFGTGYSSLSYLWRFPFDKIKIDRAFLQSLSAENRAAEMIVRTIVGLGHSLQMRVTIEGVENADQVDFVRDIGCDEAQGFYFGRPMPAADLPARMLKDLQQAPPKKPNASAAKIQSIK
jgi:diguanylate cyclase (GGDEF)-like protein